MTTNTVEGFFSLLKRGVHGTYHHWSKKYIGMYLSEFDFRYNSRENTDGERTILAIIMRGRQAPDAAGANRGAEKRKAHRLGGLFVVRGGQGTSPGVAEGAAQPVANLNIENA